MSYLRHLPGLVLLAAACFLPMDRALAQSTQTLVVPPGYATKEGNSLDRQPLGYDQSRYVQYVDASYLKGLGTSAMIQEIRYRRDGEYPLSVHRNPPTGVIQPNWSISLGNYSGSVLEPSTTYPLSTTVGWTRVFAAQLDTTIHVPDLPKPTTGTASFSVKFPFLAPFSYSGPHLGVDHSAYASTNRSYNYYLDFVESVAGGGGDVSLISTTSLGCPAGQNRVQGISTNPGGGNLELYLFGAPASAGAICFLGASSTTWQGAPLPVNLGFMGLSACNIYTDLTIPIFVVTDTAGISALSLPVPGNSAYAGLGLYSQYLVADDRVSSAVGFATSDGVKITLGTSIGSPTVAMSVNSANGFLASRTVGFVQPGRGAIFQLVY